MPILDGDEGIILESKAVYEGGGGIKIPGKKKGTLFLTRKRVIFEYVEGILSKKKMLGMNLPISKIRNVYAEGTISKKLVIEFERKDETIGKVKFKVNGVSEWVKEIHMLVTDYIRFQ